MNFAKIFKMKKLNLLILGLLLTIGIVKAQKADTLRVYYYENYPFSYTENGEIKGIELEIMDEFINWMMKKKDIKVDILHRQYNDFNKFYTDVKSGSSKVIGMGSVTNNLEREKDLLFSPPYMNNIAVLITNGIVPSAKIKTKEETSRIFKNMEAFVVKNSSHEKYMLEFKSSFFPELKISTTETQNNVLNKMANDKNIFGFVDIVAYWSYLKNNNNKFLKIQKVYNTPSEMLGFILPKNSTYTAYLNEFFESGFGFTSTKKYHQILEKYLGYEIIEAVEIK